MNSMKIKEKNQKFLVFTTTIEMADRITLMLKADGFNVESYHSKIHKKTLGRIMDSYRNNTSYDGPYQEGASLFDEAEPERPPVRGLVSISKVAVGFSVSDIDVGVLARSVGSMSLFPQLVGRLKRIHPNKKYAKILDLGKNISRHGFPEGPYNPPERTGLKDIDKKNITEAKDHLSMDHMIAAIELDEPELMTREKYELVLDRLKNQKTRLTDMNERELNNKLEVTDDPLQMIAIIAVLFDRFHCEDMEDNWGRPTRGYLAKNGKTVKAFVNPDSISWIAEMWTEKLPLEEEYYRKKYIKALRTRGRNMLMDKSSIWGLRYFIEFLLEQDNLEKEIISSIEETKDEGFEIVYETGKEIGYEIEDDEIPF